MTMTKTKKAINEVNKMADKEILKAQIKGYRKKLTTWLKVKAYGYERGHILLCVIIMLLAVATTV